MNQLILYCGDSTVGVCEFDLSTHIGISPDPMFVMLVGQEYEVSDPSERVLKGDAETYPGAFIEFAVSCIPQDSEVTEAVLAEAVVTEDDKLTEEERVILSDENKKNMCNAYLQYLQNFKTIEDGELRSEFEV